jgi:ADP-heptose:LPS heptosyltransferase
LGPLAPAAREPRRILVLRPDHIGDLLYSMPALALLRASFPEAELTYLVGPWGAEVARRGPPVAVQTLEFPAFSRRQAKKDVVTPYAVLSRAALRLRRQRYDVAVVLRPDHWWGALLVLVAGVPVRVGFRLPETLPLLSHAFPLDPQQHAGEQTLTLARHVAALYGRPAASSPQGTFVVCEEEHAAAQRLLADRGLGSRRLVAIQPSAGATLKSWPASRWAALADQLRASKLDVLLVGAPEDGPLLASVRACQAEPTPAAFGQRLGVSAALYARCALVIGPDGGGPHLAAAVGTPTIRLYGPASPARFGPWPPRQDQRVLTTRALACVPCGHLEDPPCGARVLPACMLGLGVDQVLATAMDVLAH